MEHNNSTTYYYAQFSLIPNYDDNEEYKETYEELVEQHLCTKEQSVYICDLLKKYYGNNLISIQYKETYKYFICVMRKEFAGTNNCFAPYNLPINWMFINEIPYLIDCKWTEINEFADIYGDE